MCRVYFRIPLVVWRSRPSMSSLPRGGLVLHAVPLVATRMDSCLVCKRSSVQLTFEMSVEFLFVCCVSDCRDICMYIVWLC